MSTSTYITEFFTASARDFRKIVMDLGDSPLLARTRAGTYFRLRGGSSQGIHALARLLVHFEWKKINVYYQTTSIELRLFEQITKLASEFFDKFETNLTINAVEAGSKPGPNGDELALQSAASNVFVIFGGQGCFNELTSSLSKKRQEIVLICCCWPEVSVHFSSLI